ncbi:GNAT family N-acetyltransferase [Aliisedimentitalea scapharcae]|uniref:GNAT family N-acetyltransferase n=1 Tax=Aliisedimentitalea scapharcae TaxID=1524259 RepID=A0ABZ2XYW6_9RHOB
MTGASDDSLRVFSFDTLDRMKRIREDWQLLERRDPEATIFLSWRWMAAAFAANPGRWRVIAVYHAGRLVAVLPLKLRVHWSQTRARLQTEIEAGGKLVGSEYTGFLCDPEWQDLALREMAQHVQTMPWSELSIRYVESQDRASTFMAAFPRAAFSTRWREYKINQGQIDNLLCPRIDLPPTHNLFLAMLKRNTRRQIRLATKRGLETGEMRVTWPEGGELKEAIRILLRLWMQQWEPSKGREAAFVTSRNYLHGLGTAYRMGTLRMPVLWKGDRPIATLGNVLDPARKRMHVLVTGRDVTLEDNFVGLLLHSENIRWAIENGIKVYDFGHGNEPYKHRFAAQDVPVHFLSVRRRDVAQVTDTLDPACVPMGLERVVAYLENDKIERGLEISRQLAEVAQKRGR